MGKILCATRGGKASYRAQDAAIALAKERGDELLFLFVVNISFLDRTARAVRPDVVEVEMAKMGEFLLEMARERAMERGVVADTILRRGTLHEELKTAIPELRVTSVVLGRPAEGGVYSLEDLEVLAAKIEAESEAQVHIL
jgi:nucleotide-binding universal stress UspA family protein